MELLTFLYDKNRIPFPARVEFQTVIGNSDQEDGAVAYLLIVLQRLSEEAAIIQARLSSSIPETQSLGNTSTPSVSTLTYQSENGGRNPSEEEHSNDEGSEQAEEHSTHNTCDFEVMHIADHPLRLTKRNLEEHGEQSREEIYHQKKARFMASPFARPY